VRPGFRVHDRRRACPMSDRAGSIRRSGAVRAHCHRHGFLRRLRLAGPVPRGHRPDPRVSTCLRGRRIACARGDPPGRRQRLRDLPGRDAARARVGPGRGGTTSGGGRGAARRHRSLRGEGCDRMGHQGPQLASAVIGLRTKSVCSSFMRVSGDFGMNLSGRGSRRAQSAQAAEPFDERSVWRAVWLSIPIR